MYTFMKVIGWSLRASAAICITWIVVSVAQGSNGLTTIPAILESLAFHAVFALSGAQLVGFANRGTAARRAEAAEA